MNQFIPWPAPITRTQLLTSYPPDVADVAMHQPLGFRAMHSQGRELLSPMLRSVRPDIDKYVLREAEFSCSSLVAFDFGDNHLRGEWLIAATLRRCHFCAK